MKRRDKGVRISNIEYGINSKCYKNLVSKIQEAPVNGEISGKLGKRVLSANEGFFGITILSKVKRPQTLCLSPEGEF